MSGHRETPSSPKPLPVPSSSSPDNSQGLSPAAESASRATSIARLTSPIPSSGLAGSPVARQIPTPKQSNKESQTPLAGAEGSNSLPGPGRSALAAALQGSFGKSPPRFGTPPVRQLSPAASAKHGTEQQSTYGSFEPRSIQGSQAWASPAPLEDPEIVKRHLVQASNLDGNDERGRSGGNFPLFRDEIMGTRQRYSRKPSIVTGVDEDEFSSLQLQGGDITREVYRWTEDADAQSQSGGRGHRSKSFNIIRPPPESDVFDINTIKVPGGFRRNHIRRIAHDQPHTSRGRASGLESARQGIESRNQPRLFTSNFIEFLTLYGHFAGEELEEDDEVLGPDEYFSSDPYDDAAYLDEDGEEDEDGEPSEGSALLTPGMTGRRRRKHKERGSSGKSSSLGAALLLLKSFVGTGVLFLPKAYLNGGMMFSNLVILGVAVLSYYCFILLVNTRLKIDASFGDMGGILYGRKMRTLILSSIALSQLGFVSAYIVFTSENLQAFILAVSNCRTWIDIKFLVLMQLIVFLPFSLIRDISKLGVTALVADFFILLGLVYLYYYDIRTISVNHGVADIINFNSRDWTLFVGTAIFTFEGIGLIIPIQESMRTPSKFPRVLAGVMVIITFIYISMGALSYAAYGSSTKTVVILNLPQDDKFVNTVQLLYSLAILLSTPLQLFPAIRIMENELFTRSGKYNPYIKWQKNVFRFFLVMVCALIAWGGAGDLDKFVALVGSFACVPLVYVYPVSHERKGGLHRC